VNWIVYSLFVSQIADALSTLALLRYGGRELNPIMAALIETAGPMGFFIVKLCVGLFLGFCAYQGTIPDGLTVGLLVFYVVLVVNNLLLVRRLHASPDL